MKLQTKLFISSLIAVMIIGGGIISYNLYMSQNNKFTYRWKTYEPSQYLLYNDVVPNTDHGFVGKKLENISAGSIYDIKGVSQGFDFLILIPPIDGNYVKGVYQLSRNEALVSPINFSHVIISTGEGIKKVQASQKFYDNMKKLSIFPQTSNIKVNSIPDEHYKLNVISKKNNHISMEYDVYSENSKYYISQLQLTKVTGGALAERDYKNIYQTEITQSLYQQIKEIYNEKK